MVELCGKYLSVWCTCGACFYHVTIFHIAKSLCAQASLHSRRKSSLFSKAAARGLQSCYKWTSATVILEIFDNKYRAAIVE